MSGKGLLKYHIVSTLWVGQSSMVYRGTDAHSRFVAIKMLLPTKARDRIAVHDMDKEARYMLKFDHPHIVKAIEYVRDAPIPALVMEYFECQNLRARMLHDEGFIHEHARDIIVQIADALAYVHERRVAHMDMKPENVLTADDGLTKIIDFALAEDFSRGWLFGLGRRRIAGTRPYIAPETIRRKAPDERTDIYSLGATLYEMLTGRPPFTAADRNELLKKHLTEQPAYLRTYRKDVSAKLDELVLQMLGKKPNNRPANMQEIIQRMKDIRVFDK